MANRGYVLCSWRERLWPAKVLLKPGLAEEPSVTNTQETLEVEIVGLKEKISVKQADAVPLEEARIEDIVSNLNEKKDPNEAVEELKYRCALKTALDSLKENVPARQVPPSKEGPSTRLSQANKARSLSSSPFTGRQSLSKEKLKSETPSRKRKQRNSPSLKTGTRSQNLKCSFIPEESPGANENGTKPSKRSTGDLCNTSDLGSQNCTVTGSPLLSREKKLKPRLLKKSLTSNKLSLKPKEEKSKRGRKRARGAGSPVSLTNGSPKEQGQPPAEGASLSASCNAGPVGPERSRMSTRQQPKKMVLCSSSRNTSVLEKSTGSEAKNGAKQVNGRKRTRSLKQLRGKRETSATVSSHRKRGCRNGPRPPAGLSDGFPSQLQEEEEENEDVPPVVMNQAKEFHLPDFEEEEGLEPSGLSSEQVFSEKLSQLSDLVDDDDDEEELPSILSHQEPESIDEGILVWCKWQRYPYWPAVVKNVKRKHRKANVFFIEGNTGDKKRSFSVSLRNLKHFDCEEKQDLIDQAKKDYRQEIEWCIQLISDYRIRVGCHSFTGSFLEYFADDISYPVRKQYRQSFVEMTFPNGAEEDLEESALETSPQKPSRKLLPDRTRAARDKANKKIVEFIVKTKGAEEHLLAILKCRKESRWMKDFLSSRQYGSCVETYLEDEEQLDLVVNYLKEVACHEGDTANLQRLHGDGVKFILDVLLPEAIIYAISAVDDIDYKKAEEKYMKGPSVSKREREKFDEEILERRWLQSELVAADSV
ncbi:PWWP domain-containing protein MUM1 [Numida meleagris]|uniref:PWWP domain-containing protein MUM1 n=1 Tax=Numida meleagris TaxID=8996 RepID=UPI000B3DC6BE|nr:PWWP domain-containing protein MUM1 [Numida meleagris]XP_021234362.1 PWWP domain-containing protein MUM1 [Numida meleagris]